MMSDEEFASMMRDVAKPLACYECGMAFYPGPKTGYKTENVNGKNKVVGQICEECMSKGTEK